NQGAVDDQGESAGDDVAAGGADFYGVQTAEGQYIGNNDKVVDGGGVIQIHAQGGIDQGEITFDSEGANYPGGDRSQGLPGIDYKLRSGSGEIEESETECVVIRDRSDAEIESVNGNVARH